MIKYLGSKKRLIPVLGDMFTASGAKTALDMFTGTTRVAQDFKRRGATVTAVDLARYSKIFADCWIATDARDVSQSDLEEALRHLSSLKGEAGYFTETFCVESRFFQPKNGERVDAIREALESDYKESPLFPILLTSLILGADRVDSTTGVQMAYVKKWADRSFKDLELRIPDLLPGPGRAVHGDAIELAPTLGHFDLAYLDPPYNQHRYFSNYHIWETLVAWDKPEHYGVACKRIDVRDESTKSRFNEKRNMPAAFRSVITSLDADILVLSYNNESWITREELLDMCSHHQEVRLLAFDSKRYVGAQIGIFNPSGERVGEVSHLRNLEWVAVAGPKKVVKRMTDKYPVDDTAQGWTRDDEVDVRSAADLAHRA
jgi:adenine-specific DNA-methyltransferase